MQLLGLLGALGSAFLALWQASATPSVPASFGLSAVLLLALSATAPEVRYASPRRTGDGVWVFLPLHCRALVPSVFLPLLLLSFLGHPQGGRWPRGLDFAVYLIVAGAQFARLKSQLLVSDRGLEESSPWPRRRRRIAWASVSSIRYGRGVTSGRRSGTGFVVSGNADGASQEFLVMDCLDGIGDFADSVLRNASPEALRSDPGTLDRLEDLASRRRSNVLVRGS
ncbi:MAG TPA: hypothetical protein VMT17_13845 [Anaeromyxobacteraceae bacterium]|nr:hypothetical protein [Anaeromyxobacteraceae bacterium]